VLFAGLPSASPWTKFFPPLRICFLIHVGPDALVWQGRCGHLPLHDLVRAHVRLFSGLVAAKVVVRLAIAASAHSAVEAVLS
jgi:hypothetical protein